MVNTFVHPVYPELLVVCVVAAASPASIRAPAGARLVRRALGGARRAGSAALAGVLVGTVANDSGSVLLVIGTIYLGVLRGPLLGDAPERSGSGIGAA